MMSVVTSSGTAMAEATLCERHYVAELVALAEFVAAGSDDVSRPLRWADSSGNDAVRCVECGAPNPTPIDRACDACGAEPGEECRPWCIGGLS